MSKSKVFQHKQWSSAKQHCIFKTLHLESKKTSRNLSQQFITFMDYTLHWIRQAKQMDSEMQHDLQVVFNHIMWIATFFYRQTNYAKHTHGFDIYGLLSQWKLHSPLKTFNFKLVILKYKFRDTQHIKNIKYIN